MDFTHPNGERGPVHTLLRFSFLDEDLDEEAFAHTLGFTPLDEQATLRRVATATAQIQARSRGLLESCEPDPFIRDFRWGREHQIPKVSAARARTVPFHSFPFSGHFNPPSGDSQGR